MVVLPPQGASDTYVQLPDIGANTIRAPRYGFARVYFTVKRMSIALYTLFFVFFGESHPLR